MKVLSSNSFLFLPFPEGGYTIVPRIFGAGASTYGKSYLLIILHEISLRAEGFNWNVYNRA